MRSKLTFLLLIFAVLTLLSLNVIMAGLTWNTEYTYDTYRDFTINQSLFTNTTTGCGVTEEDSYNPSPTHLKAYANGCSGSATIRTKALPNFKALYNLTILTDVHCSNSGSATLTVFGTNVLSCSSSYVNSSYWMFIKNYTNHNFDVYNEGVYQFQIAPTDSNITLYGAAGVGTSGGTYMNITKYIVGNSSLNISLTPIQNKVFYVNNNVSFTANVTSYLNNLSNISFYVDNEFNGTEIITGLINYTSISRNLSTLPLGVHSWYARICDNTQCLNSTSRNIYLYPLNENNVTYTNSTLEGSSETFTLNITPSGSLTAAYFIYNRSSYTPTINGNIITRTLSVPAVPSTQNLTFYWILTIDGVDYNTTFYNQSIINIPNLIVNQSCSPNLALNFTLYDEENLTILNGTFQYNIYYGPPGNTSIANVYGSVANSNTFNICLNTSVYPNYTLGRSEIIYTAPGYVDRRFYLFNGIVITNQTANYSLYSLLTSRQTSFNLDVESSPSLEPYVDKYTELIRWYPNLNEYKVVDMGLTDEEGSTVMHTRTEDVDYRIAVYEKNGSLIKLASPTRMVCLVDPCTYTLKVTSSEDDYISFLNVQYNFTFNETTNIWRFAFSEPTGKVSTMNLTVWKLTGSSIYTICSNIVTGSVGAVTCNTTGYTGSLRAEVTRTASPTTPIVQKLVSITTSAFKSEFGLWLTILIAIPIIFVLAMISPVVAVIGGIIALIPALFLGSVNIGIIAGLAILGGIIIHFLKRIG